MPVVIGFIGMTSLLWSRLNVILQCMFWSF